MEEEGVVRQRPLLRYGCVTQSKKGEDFFLLRTNCSRPSTSVSFFSGASPHPTCRLRCTWVLSFGVAELVNFDSLAPELLLHWILLWILLSLCVVISVFLYLCRFAAWLGSWGCLFSSSFSTNRGQEFS
ncbi:hypothetical protein ACP4OV_015725 [Aristida adscensionis]